MGNKTSWLSQIDLEHNLAPEIVSRVLREFARASFLDRAASGQFVTAWCETHDVKNYDQIALQFWDKYSKEGRITREILLSLETSASRPEETGVILLTKKEIMESLSIFLPPPLAELVFQYQSGVGGAFIRKWGSSGSEPGQLQLPASVALSDGDNYEIFVLDQGNKRVQVFDSHGTYKRQWPVDSPLTALAVWYDEVYVLGQYSVRVFTLQGQFIRSFGVQADFASLPQNLALASDGKVFVLNSADLSVFNAHGDCVKKIDLYGGGCVGIAVSRGEVFITRNHSVVVLSEVSGLRLRSWGLQGSGDGQFWSPCGIVVSGEEVFVSDVNNHRIQVFTLNGRYIKKWDAFGSRNGHFKSPRSLVLNKDGEMFVADSGNNRIQVFFCCHGHSDETKSATNR